jgi:c-di-GMP-binding flagellar brake protein YcgR
VFYFTDIYPRPKVATTVNLSLGGARIETPYGLDPKERLEIAIAIHPQTIKCRAKVVYIQSPNDAGLKAGVRFEELSEDDKLHLRQYLSKVMEQQSSPSPK